MTLRHAALLTTSMQVMSAATDNPAAGRMMDEAAFQIFYQRTAPRLRSYIHRSAGRADVADDILQDAFLRFLRVAPGDLEPSQRKAYLFKIASSLLVDHWRRVNREQRWDWKAFVAKHRTTDSTLELGHDVSEVFRTLKPRQRSLLWLAYVEGFEHREIASMLGLREKSVKLLLFRAKRNMAETLRKKGFGPKMKTAEVGS